MNLDRFAYTADLHLSEYGNDKVDKDTNMSEKLTGIKRTIYNIADYCVSKKIPTLVIGGDLLHDKSKIYSVAQNILLDFFKHYKDTLDFVVIDGNHDLSGKGAEVVSALKPLASEPNVKWITNVAEQFEDILFVPNSVNMISEIKKGSAKYLVSHLGLNEATLSSGISVVADLKFKNLRGRYNHVLLGHYHKPQEFGDSETMVYYVGSPVQLDWGEKNEDKRFLVVDRINDTIESIETVGYKKYFQFDLTPENKTEVIDQARLLQSEGHHVNIKKVEDVEDEEIALEFHVIDRTEKDITNRGITTSMSKGEIVDKFLEIRNIPKAKAAQYKNIALRIMEGSG